MAYDDDIDTGPVLSALTANPQGLSTAEMWDRELYGDRISLSKAIGRLVMDKEICLVGQKYLRVDVGLVTPKRTAAQQRLYEASIKRQQEEEAKKHTQQPVVADEDASDETEDEDEEGDGSSQTGDASGLAQTGQPVEQNHKEKSQKPVRMGKCRRNSATGDVFLYLWSNKTTYMSISVIAARIGLERKDVATAIQQNLIQLGADSYVVRMGSRQSATYRWNDTYTYPFKDYKPEDDARLKYMTARATPPKNNLISPGIGMKETDVQEKLPTMPAASTEAQALPLQEKLRTVIVNHLTQTGDMVEVLGALKALELESIYQYTESLKQK